MRFDDIYIAGTGVRLGTFEPVETAIADGRYTAERAKHSQQLGVTVAEPGVYATDYASSAGAAALKESGHDPADVVALAHQVVMSDAGEMWSTASAVQAALGIGGQCLVSALHQGCDGLNGALWAVLALVAQPEAKAVMTTAAEVWPAPMVEPWGVSTGFPCGAGGAAAVFSRVGGPFRLRSLANISVPALEGATRGDDRHGPEVWPVRLDERAEYFGARYGAELVAQIKDETVTRVMRQATADAGVELDDLSWLCVPFLSRWLSQREIADALDFPLERTTWEIGRSLGHMGAADAFVGLHELRATGALKPGDLVGGMTYGGGFTWSGMVAEYLGEPQRAA